MSRELEKLLVKLFDVIDETPVLKLNRFKVRPRFIGNVKDSAALRGQGDLLPGGLKDPGGRGVMSRVAGIEAKP